MAEERVCGDLEEGRGVGCWKNRKRLMAQRQSMSCEWLEREAGEADKAFGF